MDIIRTRAHLTATTGLVTSLAVCLSAPDRSSAAIMAARASTGAPGITAAMTSTIADTATSDADTMRMASVVATGAAVAKEEISEVGTNAEITRDEISMVEAASTAAEISMAEAASTAADAGKFHRGLNISYGRQNA